MRDYQKEHLEYIMHMHTVQGLRQQAGFSQKTGEAKIHGFGDFLKLHVFQVGTAHKCTTAQAICQQTADTYEQKVLLISYKEKAST